MSTPPAPAVSAADLQAWCVEVADGFRRHEHQLGDRHGDDRDALIVEFALRALKASDSDLSTRIKTSIKAGGPA